MPPRTKPTPEKKPKKYWPSVWGNPLSGDAIVLFYYADQQYRREGRQLDKDEVVGVLAISQDKSLPPPGSCARMFERFADRNDEFIKVYRDLALQNPEGGGTKRLVKPCENIPERTQKQLDFP